MKKIICLWAGAGVGKSTTCAGLFYEMKNLGLNVEMNREYVKDWVWENHPIQAGDQVYIAAKQARKEVVYMRAGLDAIITDSPIGLCAFYGDLYDKYEREIGACRAIVKQHYYICKDMGYSVEHYLLGRKKPYNPAGRLQDESTAIEYDGRIKEFLDTYPIHYKTLDCDDHIVKNILMDIGLGK